MPNSIAYGFIGVRDLFPTKVSANPDLIQTAIEDSIAEYQRQLDEMLNILVQTTTKSSWKYALPGSTTLQPLDQWGNPLPVKPSGNYAVGLPLQSAGIAWGDNRESRAKMTVERANELTLMVQGADMDWIARHILAALFTDSSWTFVSEEEDDVTVQPLANGDAVKYVMRGGRAETDNHYSAQAAGIDNSNNPYPILYTELNEHPSNSGPFVSYIATDLVEDTEALSTFIPVATPDVRVGIGNDTIVGQLSEGFGDRVLGKVGDMWIVEWGRLPDGYILALAQGAEPTVGWREEAEAELQGLIEEFQNVDGNRQLHKFIRKAGFGVLNRVAAAIRLIGAGGYAVPDDYEAPLAI